MKKNIHFSISINAPREKVWHKMLDLDSYKEWASAFMDGSCYDGSWEKGAKIKFFAAGSTDGMSSVIAENKPFEFISIRHVGFIKDGIEDTESPEVKAWAPSFENYTFTETDGHTEVKVDMEVAPSFEQDMIALWPKALLKLKEICE